VKKTSVTLENTGVLRKYLPTPLSPVLLKSVEFGKSFSLFGSNHRDPFDHHHKAGPAHRAGQGRGTRGGEFQGAALQSFIVQNKSAFFPAQEFDPVTPVVDKNEHLSGSRASLELITNNPAQSVKTFPHVGWLAVQVIATGTGQGKHGLSF